MPVTATPKQIIFWCVCRYLTKQQVNALKEDLGSSFAQQKKFIEHIKKHMDIERLRTEPVHRMDILVYNYILCDFKGTIRKNKLLAKYEREVMQEKRSKVRH
jgi:hypothetical protein